MNSQEPIWSVSAVNKMVKDTIEGSFMPFWMGGEVGSLLMHRSGHVYFQMKDERSQIRVCWFGGAEQCRALGVNNGTIVEVWGSLSVYDVRGEYQFVVRKLRLAGAGVLHQQFEMLKNKLAAEGLFDPARKKPLPFLPRTIGVVSSPSGAAIRDFLQIINRRFPNVVIKIYPAKVQGENAASEVAAGVDFFNRTGEAEVIVVTRGGGSMEDLWCFNDENLARMIAASKLPVISAVGHEIDFTICDFVADMRAPTPSAAAELVIGNYTDITRQLDLTIENMMRSFDLRFAAIREELQTASATVDSYRRHPELIIKKWQARLNELNIQLAHISKAAVAGEKQQLGKLINGIDSIARQFLSSAASSLDNIDARIYAYDPMRQLERGFAMVYDSKKEHLIASSKNLSPGTEMIIRFADGEIRVKTV